MASRQETAKLEHGYRVEPHNCGNCKHRKFDLQLPTWMVRYNAQDVQYGRKPTYGEQHRQEVKIRCGIGGFAIKKTATCDRWEEKK